MRVKKQISQLTAKYFMKYRDGASCYDHPHTHTGPREKKSFNGR